ncbi:MAG: hypothetical protein LUE10_02460 [Alistipes sp.]|nr:hypothetical protein [Alistipes sp.]
MTGDEHLSDDDPPLDHRWNNMFCDYNYYAWGRKAWFYHSLVSHRIEPHPAGWNGKWEPRKKKMSITVPR